MEHIVKTPNKLVNSIIFKDATGCDLFVREDVYYVSGNITSEQAQSFLDAHNPGEPVKPTIEEKLAYVGLSLNDLKTALGL